MTAFQPLARCFLLLSMAPGAASSAEQGSQILEEEGRVGAYLLGEKLKDPPKDSRIQVSSDAAGTVRAITIFIPGMFTQRFVTIGQSLLREVLDRYGKAGNVRREAKWLILEYDFKQHVVVFGFDNTPGKTTPSSERTVDFVSLRGR